MHHTCCVCYKGMYAITSERRSDKTIPGGCGREYDLSAKHYVHFSSQPGSTFGANPTNKLWLSTNAVVKSYFRCGTSSVSDLVLPWLESHGGQQPSTSVALVCFLCCAFFVLICAYVHYVFVKHLSCTFMGTLKFTWY